MSVTSRTTPNLLLGSDVPSGARHALGRALLACGAGYALLYVLANDLVAASLYDGYDRSSQAISELSATGSPAQPFLTALAPVFSLLLIAFGIGVWRSAAGQRALRVVGGILVAQGLTSFLWLVAPMSQREELGAHGGTIQDTLHLVLSAASILFILSELGFSAATLGGRFRAFAIVMIIAFLASTVTMGVLSPALAAGEATPWLGIVERVMLGAWLLWMGVLSVALLVRGDDRARRHS